MYEIIMYDNGRLWGSEELNLSAAEEALKKLLKIALSDYVLKLDDIVYDEPMKKIKCTPFEYVIVKKISDYHFGVIYTGNVRGEESKRDIMIRKISVNELL